MKIYIYNNNFTEQSIRQMITTISFINASEVTLNPEWKKYLKEFSSLNYMDFNYFMKGKGIKGILFFNIIDGYRLKKYKKDVSLIFRPRGIVPEESYYKNKNKVKRIILNIIESKVIKLTDQFIFLNKEQKNHYLFKYKKHKNRINNAKLLPNVKMIDQIVNKPIKKKDKLKIVYSGGFSKWQNIDLIFDVVSNIILTCDFPCEFTILTFEENFNKARQLAHNHKIEGNIVLKYVQPNELDEELIKYDIGIIIRDNNDINLTASPFKIIDYVSNGLALILTDNITSGLNRIIKDEYYFTIEYDDDGKLSYSKKELNEFVIYIANLDNANIIESYRNYLSGLENIKF